MTKHRHMFLVRQGKKWKCMDCKQEGDLGSMSELNCEHKLPPCKTCGQTPECAPNCKAVLLAIHEEGNYVAGEDDGKRH